MARHEIKGSRSLSALIFGTGWVETQCGMEVPAGNGPDRGEPVDCQGCRQASEPKLFLGLF